MFVTVSEKGQVVIPSSLRAKLGISAGTRLEVSEQNGNILMLVEAQRKTLTAQACIGVDLICACPRRLRRLVWCLRIKLKKFLMHVDPRQGARSSRSSAMATTYND